MPLGWSWGSERHSCRKGDWTGPHRSAQRAGGRQLAVRESLRCESLYSKTHAQLRSKFPIKGAASLLVPKGQFAAEASSEGADTWHRTA